MTFLATNDVPGTELNTAVPAHDEHAGSIPGFLFYPHVGQVTHRRARSRARPSPPTRDSRRQDLRRAAPTAAHARKTACARTIVSTLAKQAFRRPVDRRRRRAPDGVLPGGPDEGGTLRRRHRGGAAAHPGGSRSSSIAAELEPANVAAGKSYRISDLALASRLSFFLWSSIPDDELMTLAAQGRLREPAVLEQQVRRMLADRSAEALVAQLHRPVAERARR